MNKALQLTSLELGFHANEYCVYGGSIEGRYAHYWYIGTDTKVDERALEEKLDQHLKQLNDDYAVERQHALKHLVVKTLPNQTFIDFLASKNKIGGQGKFPRVLKGKVLNEWLAFLETKEGAKA